MKIITIVFLIFISAINCYTQEFGTLNSEWIYDYNGFWAQGVTIIRFEKDTILSGVLTQVYTKRAIRRISHSADTTSFNLTPIYIRSKDGIILISVKGEVFDTLINYKAEIGRSWNINKRYNDNSIASSIKITILDTFRTNFSGVNVFTQSARYTWPQFLDYVDTVYEYMGSRFHYINPFDELEVAVDGGEGGEIRCFRNDKIGLVSFRDLRFGSNYPYDCQNLSANGDFTHGNIGMPLSVTYQNFILHIENSSSETYRLNISDINGRLKMTDYIYPGLNTYELLNMPNGIYILSANENYLSRIIH
ncbi:MAG: hypothetical protein ABI851_08370 [Saprospiraceae bacterium]